MPTFGASPFVALGSLSLFWIAERIVCAVVDCHSAAFGEGNAVAYLYSVFHYLDDVGNVVVGLKGLQDGLKGVYIGIQSVTLSLESLDAFLVVKKFLPYGGVVEAGAGDGQQQYE